MIQYIFLAIIPFAVYWYFRLGDLLHEKYYKGTTEFLKTSGWYSLLVLFNPEDNFRKRVLWKGYALFVVQKLLIVLIILIALFLVRA